MTFCREWGWRPAPGIRSLMQQLSSFKPQLQERSIRTVMDMPQENKPWYTRYYQSSWHWIEDTYLKYFGENRTSYGVKGIQLFSSPSLQLQSIPYEKWLTSPRFPPKNGSYWKQRRGWHTEKCWKHCGGSFCNWTCRRDRGRCCGQGSFEGQRIKKMMQGAILADRKII